MMHVVLSFFCVCVCRVVVLFALRCLHCPVSLTLIPPPPLPAPPPLLLLRRLLLHSSSTPPLLLLLCLFLLHSTRLDSTPLDSTRLHCAASCRRRRARRRCVGCWRRRRGRGCARSPSQPPPRARASSF
eukprot:2038679-Rhodomonas_salina.1